MNTEDEEFKRIEAEIKRRAARDEDDDTQTFTSESAAVYAYRLGYEAGAAAEPVCPACKAEVLYECVFCSSNNYPPPQDNLAPLKWTPEDTAYRPGGLAQLKQEPAVWKLVPIKPTHGMLKAMDECSTEGYDERLYAGHAASVYMAAVDVAPIPPAKQEPEFFTHNVEQPYDWSEWVCPDPKNYLMKCCDCGLVHEAEFGVVRYKSETEREDCDPVEDPNLQAVFRMRRNKQWSPEDTAHRAGGLPMEQPEQKPMHPELRKMWEDHFDKCFRAGTQRTWVGLTDDEIRALASWWPSYDQMPALMVLAKDIQNLLKERNND